jgi:tRNA-specific 2-thiouridylase
MTIDENIAYLKTLDIVLSHKQYQENTSKTVVVGMSGGVDSSVTALLVKMQGYKTIGIFMKNWEEEDENGRCTSEKDYADVTAVAEQLEIPYFSVNFVKEYRENVFQSFLDEYEAGFTPNPDILCNKEIKFKVFFQKAKELGADFLATGHYCQKQIRESQSCLIKGADQGKDQTYFLYTMQESILNHVLFPIGGMQKKLVRKVATDFDLATASKKDSTGICFIGERNFKKFLSHYISEQKGSFIRLDDQKLIGPHDGYCFYTIGQRKGLGLGGPGGPWFVADKEKESNTVFVVEGENHPALYASDLICEELSWVSGKEPQFPLTCKAKIRYRQEDQSCKVFKVDGKLKVLFDRPQRAIAIRQSVVFYQNDLCLGGGVITARGESFFEQGLEHV